MFAGRVKWLKKFMEQAYVKCRAEWRMKDAGTDDQADNLQF